MKKLIGILLSAILLSIVICTAPFAVSAAVDEPETLGASSGTTGDCTWTLDDNGTLTISGNGSTDNYTYKNSSPWGTNIKNVVIEYGITSIGDYAFYDCDNLTSITIPESVTIIRDRSFYECTGLTSISIPDSVTSIGSESFHGTAWYNNQPNGLVYVGKIAYKYKGTMPVNSSIALKDGTKGITGNAFYDCASLESVIIPNSVTSIGYNAFYNCTTLTSITIPESVTNIGYWAFYNCQSITSTTIPDSVTSIGEYAFYGCKKLASVTIGDGVTAIGNTAFGNCGIIDTLIVPDSFFASFDRSNIFSGTVVSNEYYYNKSYNETINITKYSGKQKSIVFPGNLFGKPISLGKWLLANNTEIESVVIPDSVTKIGKGAFYNCVELKTLDIPATVTSIGEEAFTNCRSLQSLTIPKGVNKLGDESSLGYGMFENCKSLTEIKIPSSVEFIQSNAFDGCSNVTVLGARNSYAESYAAENNIAFRAVVDDAPIGDSNGDGNVDVLDAATIQKFASGMADMTNDQQYFADVNNDGVVDILDAAEIQKFAAGIITEFKKKG